MFRPETRICLKCGKVYAAWGGGVIKKPENLIDLCPECKKAKYKGIWDKMTKNE